MSVLALSTIAVTGFEATSAQSRSTWAPETVAPGDLVIFYADWPGEQAADAISIDVPPDWDVISAEAVRLGRNDKIALPIRHAVDGALAESPEPLFGNHRLLVTVRAPELPTSSSVSIVPATRVDAAGTTRLDMQSRYEFEFDLRVENPRPSTKRALRLSTSRRSIEMVREAIPDLSDADGITVAFWVKSAEQDQVLLSTWSGEAHRDYPFEFVIGEDGDLRVFAGRSGMHYSLGSRFPVADGSWRHVAFSVDYLSGLAILVVDGLLRDSKQLPDPGELELERLVLGGRSGRESAVDAMIDEIAIIPTAQSTEAIAGLARIPVSSMSQAPGSVLIDFETQRSLSLLTDVAETDLGPSYLTLHEPVDQVVAEFRPGEVELGWIVPRPEAQTIIIERSEDGFRFDEIHRIVIDSIVLDRMGEREPFTFQDFVGETGPVHFYRLRQEFDDGAVLESQMIKIGIGALEIPTGVELLGNTPNPFSTSTEVTFRVDEPTPLRLSVWSVSGHLVEYLASETREVGIHRIPFEAGNLPSGTYFLRLETETSVQTQKMIVRR